MEEMIGRGRDAITMIVDPDSFQEHQIGSASFPADYGPGAIVGTAALEEQPITVLAIDAQAVNPRFPVVYFGIIGMEEAYKMACAVYETIQADRQKPISGKRPFLLIVDTPGNAPGKVEEIYGMNKATGAYQLALAEARKCGHTVIAMVIGRAISGGFLCHGLQADHILALPKEYGTMIHVMPLTSISRITKIDVEQLETLSRENPVFVFFLDFFYQLGGVEEIVPAPDQMRARIAAHIAEVKALKCKGSFDKSGPWSRGELGAARGGRKTRKAVLAQMEQEFSAIADEYIK